ncbi:putative signal peptide protein [Aquitalea magnusonii]|jgi:uncharacterized membrane protein|uniref:Putative signal peptide protein n=1 Tax=Aquitalea magnusonii TaxID=332411 RepID=A0A3G9GK20_9NEIS|nr:DUF2282 domain-containing protein [Aquitalea magnusonii]BBF86591.1 putative signal peptide protein [Aquitalea magnusonii]
MNASKTLLASAMGAVVTLAALAAAPAQAAEQEKCYGVAMAGMNDCASATGAHGCKGQATVDKDPGDWKLLAKGSCQQMGGNTMAPMKQ